MEKALNRVEKYIEEAKDIIEEWKANKNDSVPQKNEFYHVIRKAKAELERILEVQDINFY